MTANVSVVIPCFNASRFLAAALDSVLAQSRPPLEVVFVDDGSTDDSLAIARRYADRTDVRFVVETGPNRGVSAARNRGIALAHGDFLQFLDADDLLRPHALATRVDALAGSGDDVAYSGWQELVETKDGGFIAGRVRDRRWQSYADEPQLAVLRNFWGPPASLLYRRTLVDRIGGFDTRLRYVEDGRLLFDAARASGRLRHVAGVGADYRRLRGRTSESRRDPAGFARHLAAYTYDVEALWRGDGPLDAARIDALVRRLGYSARVLYDQDRPAFDEVYRRIQRLDARFIPHPRASLRLVARLVGYPRSEALAALARRGLRRLRRDGGS